MFYPTTGLHDSGSRSGRLLTLTDSHLSGNTYFDIVTNNDDGAQWDQVGEEIKVAVSASTNSQKTTYLRQCISYRFWDTGVKVRENPCCTLEFTTNTGCTPHQSDATYSPYHVFGFVTAPEGELANINFGDAGGGGSSGTSWSSVRWSVIRWNEDTSESVQLGLRQGDNTFTFGGDLDPMKNAPTNYRFTLRHSEMLFAQMDGTYQWESGFLIFNYPGSNGDGDNNSNRTIATDTPISDGDHNIYVFVGIGRKTNGGDDDKVIQGKYKIWVE